MSNYPLICGVRYKGGFWLRVKGYGFSVRDTRVWMLLFSERNRLVWGWRVGPYYLKLLGPGIYNCMIERE